MDRTVVEGVSFDGDGTLVVHVRPRRRSRQRCGRCGRRARWYDRGEGRRRWRSLDLGPVVAVLEAHAPRVDCPVHGPTVIAFGWVRHGAGHTRMFDDQVAWLAVHTSKTAVAELMRMAWRTVGAICVRVSRDGEAAVDRLAGLRRIGVDELSYKRGHRYITGVVDHDTGRLVWGAPGRDKDTVDRFFDLLGPERCAAITQVSTDGAEWITDVVDDRCPDAVRGADPYHVVGWATEALDEVRREVWNTARGGKGRATEASTALKNARWALWKNPDDLTEVQQARLDWIATTHPRPHRALKEGLRWVFQLSRQGFRRLAVRALDRRLSWARRSYVISTRGAHCELGSAGDQQGCVRWCWPRRAGLPMSARPRVGCGGCWPTRSRWRRWPRAGHVDQRRRLLPRVVTVLAVLALCLFRRENYDLVLARVFATGPTVVAAGDAPSTGSALAQALAGHQRCHVPARHDHRRGARRVGAGPAARVERAARPTERAVLADHPGGSGWEIVGRPASVGLDEVNTRQELP